VTVLAPSTEDLQRLVRRIAERIGGSLERTAGGLLSAVRRAKPETFTQLMCCTALSTTC
jgi:hypothetical protein